MIEGVHEFDLVDPELISSEFLPLGYKLFRGKRLQRVFNEAVPGLRWTQQGILIDGTERLVANERLLHVLGVHVQIQCHADKDLNELITLDLFLPFSWNPSCEITLHNHLNANVLQGGFGQMITVAKAELFNKQLHNIADIDSRPNLGVGLEIVEALLDNVELANDLILDLPQLILVRNKAFDEQQFPVVLQDVLYHIRGVFLPAIEDFLRRFCVTINLAHVPRVVIAIHLFLSELR